MPTFSIITPCYNDGEFIERAFSSVLAQSNNDWELVLVDDGSQDATPQIAERFGAELGNRFIYHRQSNLGVSAARNAGIKRACGDYLIFLDADDELLPEALANYATAARQSQNSIDWIIGGFQIERNGSIKTSFAEVPETRRKRFQGFLSKNFRVGNISNMCFRFGVFEHLDFPENLRVGEDHAVFLILFTTTDPLLLTQVTALAHRRDDSLRKASSFTELVDSPFTQTVFEHPLLAEKYQRFLRVHLSQHGRSLMKRAYKAHDFEAAVTWYEYMVKQRLSTLANPKLAYRYIRARLAKS